MLWLFKLPVIQKDLSKPSDILSNFVLLRRVKIFVCWKGKKVFAEKGKQLFAEKDKRFCLLRREQIFVCWER